MRCASRRRPLAPACVGALFAPPPLRRRPFLRVVRTGRLQYSHGFHPHLCTSVLSRLPNLTPLVMKRSLPRFLSFRRPKRRLVNSLSAPIIWSASESTMCAIDNNNDYHMVGAFDLYKSISSLLKGRSCYYLFFLENEAYSSLCSPKLSSAMSALSLLHMARSRGLVLPR